MTCRDIDELMSSAPGIRFRTREAVDHLSKCGDCRGLMRVLNEDGNLAPPRTHLSRIQARIVENLTPVRPLASSGQLLFACAIIFFCIVVFGVSWLGMGGWRALSIPQKIAVFVSLGTSAGLLSVSTVDQMVPGSKSARAPASLPIEILAVLVIVIAAAFRPQEELTFVPSGLVCMKNGLTYAIPAALLFWLVVRRGAILYPKLMGVAIGGLAGLTGLSILEMSCANQNIFHILAWHWGLLLITSGAGAVLGAAVEYVEV
jgi:hypothetical protein